MDILVLAKRFYPPWSDGGVSYTKSLLTVFAYLRKKGKKIGRLRVLTVSDSLWLSKIHYDELTQVQRIPVEITCFDGVSQNAEYTLFKAISKLSGKKDVDLVHITYPGLNPFITAFAMKKFPGVKRIFKHIYMLPIEQRFILEKLMFQSVKHFRLGGLANVYFSFSTKILQEMYDYPEPFSAIIPHAVDTSIFKVTQLDDSSKAKAVLGSSYPQLGNLNDALANDFLILYLGPIIEERFDCRTIFSSLKSINKNFGLNVGIIAVGRGYPDEYTYLRKVNAYLTKEGLKKHAFVCIKHLKTTEKIALFNIADFFIYPFFTQLKRTTVVLPPIALLEAMSVGNVVITSGLPGLDEVIEDGKNGFLLKDRADLTNCFCDAIAKKEIVSKNARETIEKKYSVEAVANQYLHLLKNLYDE